MTGSILQLVAKGAHDLYFTANPQITFFKVVYRRHTNFSIETKDLIFNDRARFGQRSTCNIRREGDLIHKAYLRVVLEKVIPTVTEDLFDGCSVEELVCADEGVSIECCQNLETVIVQRPVTENEECIIDIRSIITKIPGINSKFAWVKRLGHALLDAVELDIGGIRIDKHYGIWYNIWYELTHHDKTSKGYLRMIGDTPELTTYDSNTKPEYTLFIPLQFWFNKYIGTVLPLVALHYHEVKFHFEFRRKEYLIIANEDFKNNDIRKVRIKEASCLVDYIYLDSEERRRFAQVGHEYLIEQLQFTGEESAQDRANVYKLEFNHPTKEIMWILKGGKYNAGKPFLYYTHLNDWSKVLEDASKKLIKESIIYFKGTNNDPYTIEVINETLGGSWLKIPCGVSGGLLIGNWTISYDTTDNSCIWINNQSIVYDGINISNNIEANINIFWDSSETLVPTVSIEIIVPLTIRDLSFALDASIDSRAKSTSIFSFIVNAFVEKDSPCIYMLHNYGLLIDGSVNPLEFSLIQMNGFDRFARKLGAYYNYVQPYQHHTNTPADGINIYSFALHPEQHKPSGSANLSRIDIMQLNTWLNDTTFETGLPNLRIYDSQNKILVFAIGYNVLRVMDGLAGLSYTN